MAEPQDVIANLQECMEEEHAKSAARRAVTVLCKVVGRKREKERIEQLLEDVFLKFPSAEVCFRRELSEVVCKLPAAEVPVSNERWQLEAACNLLMGSAFVAKYVPLPELMSVITQGLQKSNPSSAQCALKLFIFFGQQNQKVLGSQLLSPAGQLSPILAVLLQEMLTVLLFQTQAFEGAHLAARATTVLLKCTEKEEVIVSQRFIWTFLQLLNGATVPEEEMTLGCVSVAVADLVSRTTNFQREFALLSFVKALLSSNNNLILFTEDTLQTSLFYSFFELIKELYSRLKDAQLLYQFFQVCSLWLEVLLANINRTIQSDTGHKPEHTAMTTDLFDFFMDMVWNHGDNPIEGVPQLSVEVFKNLLRVCHACQSQDPAGSSEDLFDNLCDQLLWLPWHVKSRYTLLEVLLQYVDQDKILTSPLLLVALKECLTTNSLAPAASHFYEAALLKVTGLTCPLEVWQKYWFDAVIGCLLGNQRLQQHNARQYWLPVTCRLIPGAFAVMLKPIRSAVLRQQGLEETAPCEETHDWEVCPPAKWTGKYRGEKESVVLVIQEAPFDLLLHALLALLRVGREHNLVDLALLKDNEKALSLGLKHWDDGLRIEGLALLTATIKSLEPLALFEVVLLKEGIAHNLNLASAASRQKFAALLKKLTRRIRESSLALHRALLKAKRKKSSDPSEVATLEEELTCGMSFLQWLVGRGVSCLYPRASYQSMKCGVTLLAAVYEIFVQVEGEGPRRKGGVPDGAAILLEWAEENNVCCLIDKSVETSLLCCLVEGQGDLPAKAADMLSLYFHWPAGPSAQDGFTELEVLNQALRLCSTPGTACPHLGAQLFRMVFLRCAPGQLFTAELPHEKVKLTADLVTFTALEDGRDKTKHCAQLHLIGQLVALLELFHCHGDTDVLHTANKLPLHGLLQALQLCLPDLLTHYRQLERLAVGEFPLDPMQELLCSVLQVTQKICNSVLATLSLSASSLLEEELGISPSFADMGLAIEQAIVPPHPKDTVPPDLSPHLGGTGPVDLSPHPKDTVPPDLSPHPSGTSTSDLSPHPSGTSTSDLSPDPGGTGPVDLSPHPSGTCPSPALASCKRHTDVTSLDHQLVLSYCWLALKETSTVLAVIAQKLSELGQEVWSVENWKTAGDILISILMKCRHKGAIEAAEATFKKFCSSTHAHHSQAVRTLVPAWMAKVLDVVTAGSSVSSITRQSAGIPKCIEAMATTEPRHQQSILLKTCVEALLQCASAPVVGVVSETVDLPQVQAMNVLKVLFRSTASGSAILQFAAKGMTLAISSLASPHWSIRNAATLLYGALVLRMLGHREVVDEKGRQSTLAVHEFFARYPSLEPFLLGHLCRGVDLVKEGTGAMCPSVHPTLLLLSKLAPPTSPRGGLCSPTWQEYRECIEQLSGSGQHSIRTVAASALAAFVQQDHLETVLLQQLQKIPTSPNMDMCHNEIHGLLLQARALLSNHHKTQLSTLGSERMEKEIRERLWLSTSCNLCPLTRAAYLSCVAELTAPQRSDKFDEVCLVATNYSLAGLVAYANEQGSPQPGDVIWIDSSLQLLFSVLHSQRGALDVENAASFVCRLLQCTNTDIVSTVLRHISECEVSPAILFCAKGLCAIQTCTLSLFESKHSVAAMQAYSSSAHATEDADLMNTTFAFLLRVLGKGVDAAHSLSPPSVTAAALVALGNLLEGALPQPGLWNDIADHLERSVKLYSHLVYFYSQADQYGSIRLATAAMLRRVGPLLLVMCDEAGPLPAVTAPVVAIQTMITAAVQSWRAAVLMVLDEDEEVRFEAVQVARELAEDTSHQCVGLSAASSLDLLFAYLANHYWWSGEGWDALVAFFSFGLPSLSTADGPAEGGSVLFEPEAANPYHEDLPLYCLAGKALKSVFVQVCQWSSGFLGKSPLPQQLLSWLQHYSLLAVQTLLESSKHLSQMEQLSYLCPSACRSSLMDSFISCVYFMAAAGSVVSSDCRTEQNGCLTWLFDVRVLLDSIRLWKQFVNALPVVTTAIDEFVAASKVQPSVLVLSSWGQQDSDTELAAVLPAPPHTPGWEHHGSQTLFDRLIELNPNCINFT